MNYAQLKTTLIQIDGSNDIAGFIDTAIAMAESEMYANPECILSPLENESSETGTIASSVLALPEGFIDVREFLVNMGSEYIELEYRAPGSLQRLGYPGIPTAYTVIGSDLELNQTPDQELQYRINYVSTPTPLSSSNPTNAVLTSFPNVYIMGCLYAINLRNAEEEKAAFYYSRFIKAIKGANSKSKIRRHGPNARVTVRGSTP